MNKLGIRMKIYENVTRNYLTRRVPVLIRIDGKSFHSFTKGFQRPFDELLISTMQQTAKYLCENIQGCKLAYTQSDEITLLLTDYETIGTQGWFDYNIQKIVSVSASMATLAFNKYFFSNIMDAWEEEIISLWEMELKNKDEEKFNIIKLRISCGSGVYVRGLAHAIGKKLDTPALALKIIRTKIGEYGIN